MSTPTGLPPFDPKLPESVIDGLRAQNPHWEGRELPPTPRFHRALYPKAFQLLKKGLAPSVVVRGPRRVGKTVLMRQAMRELLAEGVSPRRILFVSFDELPGIGRLEQPVLQIARWFERRVFEGDFNAAGARGEPAYLFFDEIQNIESWAPELKHLVDIHAVRVYVTGSSSLRIQAGSDSLAGRMQTLTLGPLSTREIAEITGLGTHAPCWVDNGMGELATLEFWRAGVEKGRREREPRLRAFRRYSERGGYPMGHERPDLPWEALANYLEENVIRRAIQHDLRIGSRGRKRDGRLLEEVFRLACRYAGQAPGPSLFVPEVQKALAIDVGWMRISNYLRFLDGTLLLQLVEPMELRLKKARSPSKVCLGDPALRASWLQEVVPLDPEGLAAAPHLADLAGRIAESTLGYFLSTIPMLELAHFPARPSEPEIDFVMTIGTKRIPIEVKYRRKIDPHEDTRGLRSFLERTYYDAPFGLLVSLEDDVEVRDPRIVPISLSSLLWMR